MRILKTLYLVPLTLELLLAVLANLIGRRTFVNANAVLEYRLKKLDRFKIGKRLFLPGVDRIEDRKRLARVDCLVVNGKIVGDRLSAFLFDKAVDLLEVRCRDLFGVFAYLDLRNDLTLVVFNGTELVDAAENGRAL